MAHVALDQAIGVARAPHERGQVVLDAALLRQPRRQHLEQRLGALDTIVVLQQERQPTPFLGPSHRGGGRAPSSGTDRGSRAPRAHAGRWGPRTGVPGAPRPPLARWRPRTPPPRAPSACAGTLCSPAQSPSGPVRQETTSSTISMGSVGWFGWVPRGRRGPGPLTLAGRRGRPRFRCVNPEPQGYRAGLRGICRTSRFPPGAGNGAGRGCARVTAWARTRTSRPRSRPRPKSR